VITISDPEITARDFRAAADRIRTGGLIKGAYHDGQGYCTVGALTYDGLSYSRYHQELTLLGQLIGVQFEPCPCGEPSCLVADGRSPHSVVTNWNDDPERTVEEVIALLERAEATALGKELAEVTP
jgi:hypothetical protein